MGQADLDDLGQAGDVVVARQRLQRRQVAQDTGRRVEGADEVLARAGVDAGLAAHGRVDHGEQRRRDVHDGHAAQPGRRDEAGQVGGRSTADGHDGVGAGEAHLAEHVPAVRRDLEVLLALTVGHLDRVRLVAVALQVRAHGVGALAQGRGVHDRHPLGALDHRGQLTEQAVPDHDVVRRGAAHGDARRLAHGAAASSAVTSSATCRADRLLVSTTSVATSR